MLLRKKMFMIVIAVFVFMIGITAASARQSSGNPLVGLNLTEEQVNKLAQVMDEFNTKQFEIVTNIKNKFLELALELQREDRFETRSKERAAVRKANKLVKEISSLYGQLLKTKVAYMLKAKDVLTKEQKIKLISSLDFAVEVPENLSQYQQLDLLDLGLDLSTEQAKKILRYRTDQAIKELKLELDIDYKVLDLETELTKADVESQNVNQIIMDITELGTQIIDNDIDHFLKAKDVLTTYQKKKVLHLIMMSPQM